MVGQGCSYVVHCYTETDLAYYRDTMRDVVAASHGAGLEGWLDPWGVAGIFYGGLWRGDLSGAWACRCEACQGLFRERYGGDMPLEFTAEVRAFREWSLLDLLTQMCRCGHERGLRNALCLLPADLAAHGSPQQEERLSAALERRLAEAPAGLPAGRQGALEAMLH